MPYFPNSSIDEKFGPFHLWNWYQYKDKYAKDQATAAIFERYFSIYKRKYGELEGRIAVIDYEHADPLSATLPTEIARFADAVMLAYLVTIPLTSNDGFFASSSDNFTAFKHTLPNSLAISLTFGSYVRTEQAGSLDYLIFMTPQHVPDQSYGVGDHKLLRQMVQICEKNDLETERLFRSLQWVGFAFSNAPGHIYESRIVAMTTAFEILLDMPDENKPQEFSERIRALLIPNKLPLSTRTRLTKAGNPKAETDNAVGWWCREFYGLRSKVVHGDKLQQSHYKTNDVENLRIALHLFRECIEGILVRMGMLLSTEREMQFWFNPQWIDALKLPHEAFY